MDSNISIAFSPRCFSVTVRKVFAVDRNKWEIIILTNLVFWEQLKKKQNNNNNKNHKKYLFAQQDHIRIRQIQIFHHKVGLPVQQRKHKNSSGELLLVN